MKRRRFIGITAAGAAGLVVTANALETGTASSPLAQPRLLGILRNEAAVRALGRRYRELTPHEDDARVLAQSIVGAREARSPSVAARIDARVQRDFAERRTVTLDGWVLALTEARQCALFSLLPA